MNPNDPMAFSDGFQFAFFGSVQSTDMLRRCFGCCRKKSKDEDVQQKLPLTNPATTRSQAIATATTPSDDWSADDSWEGDDGEVAVAIDNGGVKSMRTSSSSSSSSSSIYSSSGGNGVGGVASLSSPTHVSSTPSMYPAPSTGPPLPPGLSLARPSASVASSRAAAAAAANAAAAAAAAAQEQVQQVDYFSQLDLSINSVRSNKVLVKPSYTQQSPLPISSKLNMSLDVRFWVSFWCEGMRFAIEVKTSMYVRVSFIYWLKGTLSNYHIAGFGLS